MFARSGSRAGARGIEDFRTSPPADAGGAPETTETPHHEVWVPGWRRQRIPSRVKRLSRLPVSVAGGQRAVSMPAPGNRRLKPGDCFLGLVAQLVRAHA